MRRKIDHDFFQHSLLISIIASAGSIAPTNAKKSLNLKKFLIDYFWRGIYKWRLMEKSGFLTLKSQN